MDTKNPQEDVAPALESGAAVIVFKEEDRTVAPACSNNCLECEHCPCWHD